MSEKVLQGMRKAIRKLVETSAANDERLAGYSLVTGYSTNLPVATGKYLLITLSPFLYAQSSPYDCHKTISIV